LKRPEVQAQGVARAILALKVLGKDLFQEVLLASGDLPAVLDYDNKTPNLT